MSSTSADNVTIVSGFVSNANKHPFHKNGRYLETGKLLLKSNVQKIVFLDPEMFANIKETDYDPANTRLVLYQKKDMYYMKYMDRLINYFPSEHPEKNTKECLMTIWNKTEYVREAIKINPFNSETYVWVDFGIRYVCSCTDEEFIEKINRLNKPALNNQIRTGGIWNMQNEHYCRDIIRQVCWFFAGGVFGGRKDILITFADEMRKTCDELVSTRNTATWEVNLWYLIYKKFPHMFNIYPADHNDTILDGYSSEVDVTRYL
jgi:hypothetical protein